MSLLARRRTALSLAWVTALAVARPASAARAPGGALPAAPLRWWAPFDDRVLDALVAGAEARPEAQLAVVQAYVTLRTLQARELLLQRLGEAVGRQREAVAAATAAPTAEAAQTRQRLFTALKARAGQGERQRALLQAEHERVETVLAALVRRARPALAEGLAPGAGSLPQVAMDVPFHLPESLGLPAAALPELQEALARSRRARQLLEAGELALRAVELRQEAGAESTLAVLESYQEVLVLADEMAVAQGVLALAWVELLPVAGAALVARPQAAAPLLP